jgi:hypothetical protein
VDHEVEYDVDIERTGSEDAEAMRLKKHGPREALGNAEHCWIEAFEMAGLNNTASGF